MQYFLLILFVVVIAFGDAVVPISVGSDMGFANNLLDGILYSYRMVLGDFDTSTFGDTISPVTMWVFWLLCTVISMIVMLNLLIAIISETFANVVSEAENASYKEMACMISENAYLIPTQSQIDFCPDNQYLAMVQEAPPEMGQQEDEVLEGIENLKVTFAKRMEQLKVEMTEDNVKHETRNRKILKLCALLHDKKKVKFDEKTEEVKFEDEKE